MPAAPFGLLAGQAAADDDEVPDLYGGERLDDRLAAPVVLVPPVQLALRGEQQHVQRLTRTVDLDRVAHRRGEQAGVRLRPGGPTRTRRPLR